MPDPNARSPDRFADLNSTAQMPKLPGPCSEEDFADRRRAKPDLPALGATHRWAHDAGDGTRNRPVRKPDA